MTFHLARLDECTEIISGATPRTGVPSYWGGEIPWATPKDLSNLAGKYVAETPGKLTQAGFDSCSAQMLPAESVLFSSRAPIGHVAINTVPMCTNQGFKSFVPNRDRLSPDYLYHWLRANKSYLQSLGVGATFKEVSKTIVSRVEIPLPPLPEQRRIAAILDKADALRAKRREAIAKLDQLLQSIFLDMFGDPVTNPKGWPKKSLSELFSIARGGSPRPIDDFITDAEDGVNWIMIGDTSDSSKYIDATRKKIKKEGVARSRMVYPGDFLLTNSMSFGRPYILRTFGCIHDGWLVLSPNDAQTNPDYLYSILSSSSLYAEFARRAPGATVKNLNIQLVSEVEIPVPPSSLQARFAESVNAAETQKQRLTHHATQLDTLFASLQHRAFAGML